MLPRVYRLTKEKDFQQVYKKGKGVTGSLLFLKIIGNTLANSRFGIVVSRKFSKKATVRNKTKRLLREAIRQNLDHLKAGFDVVLIPKPQALGKSYKEIEEETKTLLKKANLL